MKTLSVNENDSGQRLDRFLKKALPNLPNSLMQKFIRKKRIKVNGKAQKADFILNSGDSISLYIPDEFLKPGKSRIKYISPRSEAPEIIFEDENIILLNKPSGLLSHSNLKPSVLGFITERLIKSGEFNPEEELSFSPALCNRLDRNTSGLLIAAKNSAALREMNKRIRNREVGRYYITLVYSETKPPGGELVSKFGRDRELKKSFAGAEDFSDAKEARMRYKLLESKGHLHLLECELISGLTHQIRLQLSENSLPIVGDPKYGKPDVNRKLGLKHQLLCSYKLSFLFDVREGPLKNLSKKHFTIDIPAEFGIMCL